MVTFRSYSSWGDKATKTASQVEAGHVEGALPTLNGVFGEDIFKVIDKYQKGGPYFVAEFYPAWFDEWTMLKLSVSAISVISDINS